MEISAAVHSSRGAYVAGVNTDGAARTVAIPGKPTGDGSAVNGGELLMLALATCYCNDLYREAARLKIAIESCEVEARGVFTGIGLAATDIRYHAHVVSTASDEEIAHLLAHTDTVAEIHNTVRAGVAVTRD